MTGQPAHASEGDAPRDKPAENDRPEDDTEPTTVWTAIRIDLLPLALAVLALTVNVLSPDALSPALTPVLLVAIGGVAYRIYRTVQAVRDRTG